MTTFSIPEVSPPYPWEELDPPGIPMTETQLLHWLHRLMTRTEADAWVLHAAMDHWVNTPRTVVTTMMGLCEALQGMHILLEAWWKVAEPGIIAELQQRDRCPDPTGQEGGLV